MKKHELKTSPEYFVQVAKGNKTFEVRKNDRDFKIGDTLVLKEYFVGSNTYTGNEVSVVITYILVGYEALFGDYVVIAFHHPESVIKKKENVFEEVLKGFCSIELRNEYRKKWNNASTQDC